MGRATAGPEEPRSPQTSAASISRPRTNGIVERIADRSRAEWARERPMPGGAAAPGAKLRLKGTSHDIS